ncbi:hypothetical protein PGC35_19370 [Psychrobacillus sp. PGGUH221]|uniref:oxidoreductase n=1 Tax=Psychrobacillus sp. PGGUH221 TaxID=3020058 RepID=UPI0035C77D7E
MINNDILTYKHYVQNDILNLNEADILKIISKFIDSSIRAYHLGFKVIQIHAAHGYFLSQLLSNELNKRKDKFAPLNNFVLSSIIEGIREKTEDIIIDLRISLLEGLTDPEAELNFKADLIEKLTKLDIDMISFSNGIYDVNKQLIYPLEQWGHAFFLKNIIKYAEKYPNILWNTSGNIWNIDELKLETLPNNLTFSIGRSLIADPFFVKKSFENQASTINRCEFKNKCHYYSLNLEHVGCPIYELNKTIS